MSVQKRYTSIQTLDYLLTVSSRLFLPAVRRIQEFILPTAPTPIKSNEREVVESDKSAKDDLPLRGNDEKMYKRGPWPWLTVAKKLGTSLLLDTWVKDTISSTHLLIFNLALQNNADLPNVVAEIGVYMIGRFQFSADIAWNHGNGHEKIAVDTNGEYMCFGDANHRVSEITHAGTTVSSKCL